MKHPNVYIDISAYLPKVTPHWQPFGWFCVAQELVQFANTVGKRRSCSGQTSPSWAGLNASSRPIRISDCGRVSRPTSSVETLRGFSSWRRDIYKGNLWVCCVVTEASETWNEEQEPTERILWVILSHVKVSGREGLWTIVCVLHRWRTRHYVMAPVDIGVWALQYLTTTFILTKDCEGVDPESATLPACGRN